MTETVVHVAGPAVSIKGRVVQRCAVCGLKLVDWTDGKWTGGTELEDPDSPVGIFPPGAYVRESRRENRHSLKIVPVPDDADDVAIKYPADGCIDLVEP